MHSLSRVTLSIFPPTSLCGIHDCGVQLLNEQHKLNRVIETSAPPELIEAQKEVDKLQSELKVRTKLNQLQSAKVRLLSRGKIHIYLCACAWLMFKCK